ncbi:hypothetical protein [Planctomyces sp. SH-PL14]|uniref:hypothetical protein n=1 Tax=Planctomyces sp. SH-PL14 TaxID=1632864 RepID=UPI00078DD293|nr:hypothetical protein [Planctomyces sp. SH-PL14]AMV16729.1 hypothetical protein VT03_02490 [Planctomyces sp. SH-PL14]
MRIHNWFRTIAGALALTASAETGFGQEFYGAPGQGMAAPGMGPANPAVMYPQGVPDGFNPWPQMSPYGVGNMDQEQLFNRKGLWFYEMLTKQRTFYGRVDAIWGFSEAEAQKTVGNTPAFRQPLNYNLGGSPTYFAPANGNQLPIPGPFEVVPGADPYPFMRPAGQVTAVQIIDNDIFPIRTNDVLPTNGNAGVQVNWGFDDADGVGLLISGFYMGENSEVFESGNEFINGLPVTPAMVDATLGQVLNTRNGAIAYDTGLPAPLGSGLGFLGAAQKYDILFRLEHRTEVAGANLSYYMAPVFKTSAVMVRPFLAGRYMYLNETFGFRGIDSGWHYDVDQIPYSTGTTTTTTPSTYRPDPGTWATRAIQQYPQFEARLNSNVQTHLAGPEIGLRYDLGEGDGFKVWGATTVGLMANQSNLSLDGNNIGEEFATSGFNGISMLSNDARFSSEASHGRVSPLFEQTLAVDSRVFEAVPFVNEIPVLNQAILHLGYTFTAIGQVNRPADTINWAGFPIFPSLNNNTQTFVLHRFNFGLEWKY